MEEKHTLITVCIPSYNSAPFLHYAVDSLIEFGEDIEVIIIDDGSKDETGAIADDYEKKYPFIKEVRGIGLLLGMELDRPGQEMVGLCQERGLLINCTAERVLRFMPPLITTNEEVDQAVGILDEALRVFQERG